MSWSPTLWSAIEALDADPEAQAHLLDALAVFPAAQVRPSMSVYAPCCGRRTTPDAIVDVSAVPDTPVRAGGVRPMADLDWLCASACLPRMLRDPGNGWTRSKFLRATGAPAEIIRDHRAKELLQEERLARRAAYHEAKATGDDDAIKAAKKRLWIKPLEVYAEKLASLPTDARDIPGTERP